ncbi:homoserine kinase [Erythrobacter sp. NAP1]|uniref:homoserine kinase n=1 Tax=Erythrobacter sp. NAP1 TaxID=237727 RepID=UPI0000686AE2|nr:homoserine kinase [Erythrobacter sp. NAP1]EAQ29247.1 homoserine kinase [Erythrobacter sp. NAP1]
MAVYTHLGAEDLADLIAHYDVGELVSSKGIAEGVSNSNWLIETTGNSGANTRFILTMYERRIELSDLPFFLDLMDHLAAKGCPVPRTIHDTDGANFRLLDGKAVALIEYLPGVSVDHPTAGQARSVGRALAQNHLAVADFKPTRANDMGLAAWNEITARCGDKALAGIDPALPSILAEHLSSLETLWPVDLPGGVVHCDLFPDNVLMLGERVSGLIDFYFSASDAFAYDLAVTHAAWSFDNGGHTFRSEIADALIEGYESVRSLSNYERECLPVLARGAAIRFVTSRAEDWISTPADALVTRKDPMDFVRRLEFYDRNGPTLFEGAT